MLAWLVAAVVIALGSAGIVGGLDHLPTTGARPELTYGADRQMAPGLDAATADLRTLSDQVDALVATSLSQRRFAMLLMAIFAGLALLVGAYLLIIGRRPWRAGEETHVAPRVRLLGLSYILVFGSAMVQIILQPRGTNAEILGGLMVLGGLIVIVVVFLEARASRRSIARGRLGD